MLVLALMPAVGGGTVRDVLIGQPVFWLEDNRYLMLTVVASVAVFFGQRFIDSRERMLMWADAIGLSVFCVLGASKSLAVGMSVSASVVMGIATAVAGGIIRDVIANEVPYILRKEIYATAALVGATSYVLLELWGVSSAEWIAIFAALTVRGLGIVYGWSLPKSRDYESVNRGTQ